MTFASKPQSSLFVPELHPFVAFFDPQVNMAGLDILPHGARLFPGGRKLRRLLVATYEG
jgi:hypothetical protein